MNLSKKFLYAKKLLNAKITNGMSKPTKRSFFLKVI